MENKRERAGRVSRRCRLYGGRLDSTVRASIKCPFYMNKRFCMSIYTCILVSLVFSDIHHLSSFLVPRRKHFLVLKGNDLIKSLRG